MSVLTPLDAVTRYAQEVRQALTDLGTAEVEELTEGLEADLSEALADRGPDADPWDVFGPSAAYALELSDAAQATPVVATTWRQRHRLAKAARHQRRTDRWHQRRTRLGETRANWQARLRKLAEHPLLAPVVPLTKELAPVWWVARGVLPVAAFYCILRGWRSTTSMFLTIVAALVMAAISVRLGGASATLSGRDRGVRRVLAFLAILAFPFVLSGWAENLPSGGTSTYVPTVNEGLYFDGRPVGDLFVYDSDGQLVRDARIFDDSGEPLVVDRGWFEFTAGGRYYATSEMYTGDGSPMTFPAKGYLLDNAGTIDQRFSSANPAPFVVLAPLDPPESSPTYIP